MNAVIYCRYSSYGQTERSIEGQLEDCMRYAQDNDMAVVGQYIDRAKTGTEAEHRPQFQQMVEDSAHGGFDTVIVYKLDRFARSRYDSAFYKSKLKKNGVRVASATEQITEDPEGIIIESLLEGMAEYYSANLSKHVKRGLRVAREHGTFTGGYVLYGYEVKDKHIVINPAEAEVMRYVFEHYAAGDGLMAIIRHLNEQGYLPRKGDKFTINSFQNSLHNRRYLGEAVTADDGEYPPAYPRLISDELFERVQIRSRAAKRAPAANKAQCRYKLQGKVFCGLCGSQMVGESGRGKSGVMYQYYACAEKKKHHTCAKHNEKKDALEAFVVKQTLEYVLTPERIDYIAHRLEAAWESDEVKAEKEQLRSQLAAIDHDMTGCTVIMAQKYDNEKLVEAMSQRYDQLEARRGEISSRLADIEGATNSRLTAADYAAWLNGFLDGDISDESFQQQVIDTFVNAVYVYDDKIIIYYNIKNGEQVSYRDMLSDLTGTAPPKFIVSESFAVINPRIFGFLFIR